MVRSILILFVLILGGCATFSPLPRPEAPVEMPLAYALYTPGDKTPDQWWQAFGSPELNELVEAALADNFDIRAAGARLKQAHATAQKINANRQPGLDLDTSSQYNRVQSRNSSHDNSRTTDNQSWRLGLAATYEVDLWGRLDAQRQSEAATVQATRLDLAAAAVTVSAQVATTWIDLLATRQNMSILEEQIQTNVTLLNLQRLRFSNGRAKALDVSQQRQALAAARAERPLLQRSEQLLINSLTLLVGKATPGSLSLDEQRLPALVALPATGLPADLLAARPDVQAAGLRLRAADWSVSAARADRLPNITLSAQAAFSSGSLDLLFDNWITTLAGSITSPIFDGGRRSAEVSRTRAVAEERLASYARTVAVAVKEVADSLVGENRQRAYLQLLKDQLRAARLTLKDARLQYRNGQSDYLSYLTAWNAVQRLERQLVDEEATLIKNRVALYRTLGGDWTERIVATGSPSKTTVPEI